MAETVLAPVYKYVVRPDGQIWVWKTTVTINEGKIIDTVLQRYVLYPGHSLIGEHRYVIAAARKAWTPDVVSAFEAALPIPEIEG